MHEQLIDLQKELAEKSEVLQRQMNHTYRHIRKSAREHPERAAVIAVVSGFILGWMVKSISSSHN